jgi:hypothetical protein
MKITWNDRVELTEKPWQILQKLLPQHKKGRNPIDRRNAKEDERNPASSKAMIDIVMTNRILNHLQQRKMEILIFGRLYSQSLSCVHRENRLYFFTGSPVLIYRNIVLLNQFP